VGGHWRREGEQFCVDKALDAATEGKGATGVHRAVVGQTQLHTVLHE